MALVCHWSLARGTQASISIADTGTQCTLPLTTSTSCQTGDQPSVADAEEEQIWLAGAYCPGFFQDRTGDSACMEPGQQRSSDGPSDEREVAPIATGGRVDDIQPCLKCNVEEAILASREGSQALDMAYACAGCCKLFSLQEKAAAHSQVQMGQKPYTCVLCRARSSRLGGLYLDAEAVALLKLDAARKTHAHSSCMKGLTSDQDLHNHQPHTCDACPKSFSQEDSLLADERTHYEHCTQLCSTSHGRLVCEHTLRLHTRERAGPAENKTQRHGRIGNGSFYCESCSKHFSSKYTIKRHLMSHNGQKPYSCGVCGKRFASKRDVRAHETTHSGVGPYVCSVCNKVFVDKRSWLTHERKHGSHQCNVCKEAFPAIAELADHMELHASEKPFSCSLCLRRFRTKISAGRHEKEHSSDRNHVCGTCGKAFIRKENLSLHEKTHDPEKPYKCHMCQKGFTRKDFLLHHEKTHETVCRTFS